MSLNCKEINAILSELDLEGAFIQDVIQPGFDTIALYTYKSGNAQTLLICTANNACRINLTRKKIPKNEKPLRFMELLKSRIKGARIESIEQIGLERVVRINLNHQCEKFILYVRLWSNAANIILCNEANVIIDALYRRPKKNEISGEFFLPPVPDENKKNDEWQIRDFQDLSDKNYLNDKSNKDSKNFSPKVTDSPLAKLSFNEKVDLWYSEYGKSLSRETLLARAENWYSLLKSKLEIALVRLEKKYSDFENAEHYKHYGDLILSFASSKDVEKGMLDCIDYESNANISIVLDKKKNVHENASVYYTRYKKAKSGLEQLEEDIKKEKKKIKDLDDLYEKICNEENPVKIEQLIRKNTTAVQQKKKDDPGIRYVIDGWIILVGRDSNENDELLRHYAKGLDTWLHARNFSGGYVFIKNKSAKTVPLNILLDAANLALYYSKARKQGKADIYYTQVKYLRRAKNGPKGLVIPTQEKNLFVKLDTKRISSLDSYRTD